MKASNGKADTKKSNSKTSKDTSTKKNITKADTIKDSETEDNKIMEDIEKDKNIIKKNKIIKNEVLRLNNIFKDIDKNKKLSSKGLIEEAAYMKATLKELKFFVDSNGVIDEMPQGEYSILRENPALKSYNTMIQRYTTIIKELINLLPKEQVKEVSDGFEDFVGGRLD